MSLSRRAFARLVVTGAAGLSLLPFRRASAAGVPLLKRWARLGRIWREMSAHWRNERGEREEAQKAFDELKDEMAEALDALPASPELRTLFEQRHFHIRRSRYFMATCYRMAPAGNLSQRSRGEIEKQVQELEALAADGTLSKETMQKAAEAMAAPTEYLTQSRKLYAENEERPWKDIQALALSFQKGELEAGQEATLAAERGAELSTDRLGELAGKPDEGE